MWVRGGGTLQPPEGTAPPFTLRGVLAAWGGLRASSLLPAAGPVTSGNDKTLWVGASQVNGGRVFQGEGATGAKAWGCHLHLSLFWLQPEHPHSRTRDRPSGQAEGQPVPGHPARRAARKT